MNKSKTITKVCTGCKLELPNTVQYFANNKRTKDGLESKCKSCAKIVKMKRYKNVIYEIYCTESDKYYIGQTIKPLNDRISKHFSDAKRGRKQALYQDIRKYNRDKFIFREIEHVENLCDLDSREQYWISEYKIQNKNLYNIELGGKNNIIVPEDTRIKQAIAKGIKPFYVFTAQKEFVGEYETIQNARKELGVSGFGRVLQGKALHSGRYIAIFKDSFSEETLKEMINKLETQGEKVRAKVDRSGENNSMFGKPSPNRISVAQLSLEGELICVYNCYKDIEIYNPTFNRSAIAYHIKNNTPSYKGYKWEIMEKTSI